MTENEIKNKVQRAWDKLNEGCGISMDQPGMMMGCIVNAKNQLAEIIRGTKEESGSQVDKIAESDSPCAECDGTMSCEACCADYERRKLESPTSDDLGPCNRCGAPTDDLSGAPCYNCGAGLVARTRSRHS